MIKHRAQLSVIALLILTILMTGLMSGCIAPTDASHMQATGQSADEASAEQSVAEAPAQSEQHADAVPSTPELIENAYTAGEISAEERILYLTYAVYEYESLPPAYQSDAPWRGTMVVRELDEFLGSPAFCETPLEIQSELERLLGEPVCTSS